MNGEFEAGSEVAVAGGEVVHPVALGTAASDPNPASAHPVVQPNTASSDDTLQ